MVRLINWLKSLFKNKEEEARRNKAKFNAAVMVANEGKIGAEMIADAHLQQSEGPYIAFSLLVRNFIDQIPHGAAIEIVDREKMITNVNGEAWTK